MGVSFTHVGFESLIDFADSLHYINCVTQENVPTSINSLNEDYFESLKSIINLDNKNAFLDDNEKGVSQGGTLCFAFYVPMAVIETFVELYCLALSVSLQWYQGP